jgi:hypothetical protein
MVDFTLSAFTSLLESLIGEQYAFQTFSEFLSSPGEKMVILRHDIDSRKNNSLKFAHLEHHYGIQGTYYFRTVPESYDEALIRKIGAMGHEIGYHYETMCTSNGNIDLAYDEFCRNLEKFRKLYPVKTICMHGSPRSSVDSKDLWTKYNYKDLGIIGEPYFDIDFSSVFYLTDTGRRWDGYNVSIRDKIPVYQEQWEKEGLVFHSSREIINAAGRGELPSRIMMTFHPQRWSNEVLPWIWELIVQRNKNCIKWYLNKSRQKK